MSLSNPIRIPLLLPNIEIFTFGESNLYGYDSLNGCLIFCSLNELNQIKSDEIVRLHLTSKPKSSIEKLLLNEDQTIIALLSQQTVYLVYLPQISNSPSKKGSRLCPLNEIPASTCDSASISNRLIDFLWLSPRHFFVVNSVPSSSECHFYQIRFTSKVNRIDYVQSYSVGLRSMGKGRSRKISLNHPSDIVKLNLTRRKQDDSILNRIFALKSNGDIYLMEMEENQLINNFSLSSNCFVGPIRILPSRTDNYGADYSHSKIFSLSYLEYSIVYLIRDKGQINTMILLNPQAKEFYLYTIDSIQLPIQEKNPTIEYLINDQLYSNKSYLSDSLANIYSIDLFWIDQLKSKVNSLEKTNVQHLIQFNHSIEQFNCIQISNKGQWIAIITKTSTNQQKELILFRPYAHSSNKSLAIKSSSLQSSGANPSTIHSSEFVNRIRSVLQRNQAFPQIKSPETILSNRDFEENLRQTTEIFLDESIEKQEKVRVELENKRKYLFDFQQTQLIAYDELNHKLQQIQNNFQTLLLRFDKEWKRRRDLQCHLDDLLSVIEERTPVLSDAQIVMYQQLQTYQIHINVLRKKILLLQNYLSNQFQTNNQQQQQRMNQSFLGENQKFIQYFTDHQIEQMRQQLQTAQQNH